MNKMEKMDVRTKNLVEIVLIIGAAVLFVVYLLVSNAISAKRELEESMKTKIVTDASRYFTVISCAQKFVEVISGGTNEDKLTLLDSEYKEKNRILEDTVHSYLPILDSSTMYDYSGEEMYERRLSKNVVEYYVKGNIMKSGLESTSVHMRYDMTITLYESEFTFSVKPGIGDMNEE